jgi:hypothetical protein
LVSQDRRHLFVTPWLIGNPGLFLKELYHFIKDRGSSVEDKTAVSLSCQPEPLVLARAGGLPDFCTLLPSPGVIAVITIFILLLITLLVFTLLYACYRDGAHCQRPKKPKKL